MSDYYSLPTEIGEAKIAKAIALGEPLKLKYMAVGDGNGETPIPSRKQKALVNEQRRALINTIFPDENDASQLIIEQVLPAEVGGWWVREIGVFDEDGDLIIVANCPPSLKPALASGSGKDQQIRIVLLVASASAIELKIDPTVVLATRKYVDDAIVVYAAPKDHKHPDLAPLASPTFTGVPKAPTAAPGTSTTQLATTEFAAKALALKADLASPTFTGTPKAPTAASGTNNTQLATTAFVRSEIASLVGNAPSALDTLKELADAMGNDANFSATVTNALAQKAPLASPTFTGAPKVPTAVPGTNNNQAASTEFALSAIEEAVAWRPLFSGTLNKKTGVLHVANLPVGNNATQWFFRLHLGYGGTSQTAIIEFTIKQGDILISAAYGTAIELAAKYVTTYKTHVSGVNTGVSDLYINLDMNAEVAASAYWRSVLLEIAPKNPFGMTAELLDAAPAEAFWVAMPSTSILATRSEVAGIAPVVGEVRMWSGVATEAAVSAAWGAGWHLATGANGTSNLTDRFIVGAGGAYAASATGGAASYKLSAAQLPSHTHAITVNDPGHYHDVVTYNPGSYQSGQNISGGQTIGTTYPQHASVSKTGVTASAANTGGGADISNLPPFYALCFVQYTGA
ncbi:phage-related tail fiber protein-like protein [Herbaspirillum sp. BH-1]|uniref:phage tail-collar fiber domain-containing protein n=1 Tax=Herbaspirillum sp. (strain BH-1) TaxID=2058884 RepID=UPI000C882DDF|nr:phage tail protein [Herbaspirillum sp. BH-1]PLY58463.1 phage-related tail fiber protein-like protein [Herbaspirillum sp. BH-1]